MEQRVPLHAQISRRAKMVLDNHANLWRGTPLGTISAIVDDLILKHLTEVRVSHHNRDDRAGRDA